MTNTYAINTTRGQEFAVADALRGMGLHPWVPVRLESRYVKEKREAIWYDKPYVGKLIFCLIPAIYYRDVVEEKHVIGKPVQLSRMDLEGVPGGTIARPDGTTAERPPRYGLKQFRDAVEAEYRDAKRKQQNSEYQCQYEPGQALELLAGAFEGFPATFQGVVKRAFDEYPRLRVAIEIMGRITPVEIDPDKVRVG